MCDKYCHCTNSIEMLSFAWFGSCGCGCGIMWLWLGDAGVHRSGINDFRLAGLHSCARFCKPSPGTHWRYGILLCNVTFQHAREACEQTHRKWMIDSRFPVCVEIFFLKGCASAKENNVLSILDHTHFFWESLRFLHDSARGKIYCLLGSHCGQILLSANCYMWLKSPLLLICSLCDNFSSSVGGILNPYFSGSSVLPAELLQC